MYQAIIKTNRRDTRGLSQSSARQNERMQPKWPAWPATINYNKKAVL